MPDLWVPGVEGPLDAFVERLQRRIEQFARDENVERAVVEVELQDGSRFAIGSLGAEPGWGFLTLRPHASDDREAPTELIVPVASIKRIELHRSDEQEPEFGFTLSDR